MYHQTVIKRSDGSQVMITTSILVDYSRNVSWETQVHFRSKRQRNWTSVFSTDDYEWRKLPTKEAKAEYVHAQKLLFCTEEELYQAKLELWEQIKPCL